MRKDLEDLYPLTPSQLGMLLDGLAERAGGVEQFVVPVQGPLDAARLQSAWAALTMRHAALRTAFVWRNVETPMQAVLREVQADFDSVDLSALAPPSRSAAVEAFLAAQRARGFSPSRPPLARLGLLRLGPAAHALAFAHHHAVMDGWCVPRLVEDLLAIYGGAPSRREGADAFGRYVRWLAGRDRSADETFWRQSLARLPRAAQLGSRAPTGATGHGEAFAALSLGETGALRSAARDLRVTVSALVHAAWAALLSGWTSQGDVVHGVTVGERPAEVPGVQAALGVFVRTLPLRVQVDPAETAATLASRVQHALVGLREHTTPPGPGCCDLPAGAPLFETVVAVQNYPVSAALVTGGELRIDLDGVRFHGARTRYPLAILVGDAAALAIRLVHRRDRADDGAAAAAVAQFTRLLKALAQDPRRRVGDLLPAEPPAFAAPAAVRAPSGGQPASAAEAAIAALLRDLLGVDAVGPDDDFFALGGHSLAATELVARLREAFGVEVSLQTVLEAPTVRRLGAALCGAPRAAANAIQPDPDRRCDPFPLTDVQQAYWMGRRAEFELGNTPTRSCVEIESDSLDPARIERALCALIERHDMLRAVILPDGRQQVLPRVPNCRVPVADLRGCDPAKVERELEASRRAALDALCDGAWIAITASRLDGRLVRFHLAWDPLVCDARSFGILCRELALLHDDCDARLPPLHVGFRDCVLAARRASEGRRGCIAREYWTARLASLPDAPKLPLRAPPASISRPVFQRRSSGLSAAKWAALQRRAAERSVTPSCVLAAAFAEVIAAWSEQPRFCLNLTFFDRPPIHPDIDAVVGDFTSLVLLEVDAAGTRPFAARASALQRQLWSDLDHSLYSGVRVMRELGRLRGKPSVLMPVVFTSMLGIDPHGAPPGPGRAAARVVGGCGQTPQVVLDHQVAEAEGALTFWWDAVDELFPTGVLEEMFAAHDRLLASLADGSGWTDAARSWLQHAPSIAPPAPEAARGATLWSLFEARCAEDPGADAILADGGVLSYGALMARARTLAGSLRDAGIGRGDLVAVFLRPGQTQIAAILAIAARGAAWLPVDPALPAARVRELLEESGARLSITETALADRLPGIRMVADGSPQGGCCAAEAPAPPKPTDLAYVIPTSGSTGRSKLVAVEHGAAVNTILDVNARFGVTAHDRVLALSPVSFDLWVYDVFGTFAAGGAVVVPPARQRSDPEIWIDEAARGRATVWNSAPALLGMALDCAESLDRPLPASLRLVLLSGDWIPLTMPARLRARSAARMVSLGGATEAGIWSIFHRVDRINAAWRSIPYGTSLGGQRVEILDERLEPRPPWVVGQVCIAGASLARGYLGRADLTAASFVHDARGERWYRTGDLGRKHPGGVIELLGREDRQCKVRGQRVELGEVEAALARHPRVRHAVVEALGTPGEQRLAAWVVPAPEGALDPEMLTAFLRERLPRAAVPSRIEVVDALPVGRHGKIDRAALAKSAATPPPPALTAPAVGSLRDAVALLVCDLLAIDAAPSGASFFTLGGDSLAAARLVHRLHAATGTSIGVREVFEARDVGDLAARVGARRAGRGDRSDPIPRLAVDGPVPLSSAQRRLWALDRIAPGHPALRVGGALALSGPVNAAALDRAVRAVVAQNDALRLTFELTGGVPCQRVRDRSSVALEVAELPDASPEAAVAAAREAALAPFDLARGPLFHARLLRRGAQESVLVFALHHVAADAWSLGLIAQQLSAAYEGRPLQGPTVRYLDYAAWEAAGGEARAADTEWWRARLAGVPELALPPRRAGSPALRRAGAVPLSLDAGSAARLRAIAPAAGVTPFMSLLAAFDVVLHGFTGQRQVGVGTSVAGRLRAELEGTVGCFVNLLPLPVEVDPAATFRELCLRARDTALDAFAREDVPFESMSDDQRPGRPDLLRAMLVLQNAPAELPRFGRASVSPLDLGLEGGRYDLHVHFSARDGGLAGFWRYDRDVLDDETSARLAEGYRAVLIRAAAEPDARVADLMLEATGTPIPARRAVRADRARLVARSDAEGPHGPAVLQPTIEGVSLSRWLNGGLGEVQEALRDRGAVLLRGFEVHGLAEFREVFRAVAGEPAAYVNRSTPRTAVGDGIYTATEYPATEEIPLHNEQSYAASWPSRIGFYCERPADGGGETLLADAAQVYQSVADEVRARFVSLGVMYVRNYGHGVDLSWEDAFQTSDPEVVEQLCRRWGTSFEWRGNRHLRTREVRPAVMERDGVRVWFNQAHLFHTSALPGSVGEALRRSFAPDELPRYACYGDGSEIGADALEDIRTAYRRHRTALAWRAGDVLFVDNLRVAHGRAPFRGERRVFVAMANGQEARHG